MNITHDLIIGILIGIPMGMLIEALITSMRRLGK